MSAAAREREARTENASDVPPNGNGGAQSGTDATPFLDGVWESGAAGRDAQKARVQAERESEQARERERELSRATAHAKECRTRYRDVKKVFERRVKDAEDRLVVLESAKGRKLKNIGGVTLYERWVDTPQGGGQLIGVKAEAADASSITQRLTATRMVTLGVFSLAAPKKKGAGNAYVVIEGPQVSGVATLPAAKTADGGPVAYSFAAEINNAARIAGRAEPTRPQAVEEARASLARAKDDSDVRAAAAAYAAAVAALPPERRSPFYKDTIWGPRAPGNI